MTLPSVADLALAASCCSTPVVMWCINLELIVTAHAGQLAAKFPNCTGHHIFEVLQASDRSRPVITSLRRAFLGEVVPFQAEIGGTVLDATLAPITDAKRIWGVIGSACLASTTRGTDPRQPFVYRCTRNVLGYHEGEILTRPRSAAGVIRRHADVAVEDFDQLLAIHALTPVSFEAASATDARVPLGDGRAWRLPPGSRRLSLA